MKKIKNLLLIFMCMILAISPIMTETASAATKAAVKRTTSKKTLNGWVTVKKGQRKYYKKGGYLKGCHKIGKIYYFFDANGIMQKKDVTVKGVTYYIDSNGQVLGRKKGSQYLAPNGKKLSKDKANELRAYQNARKIVAGITNNRMNKYQKLETCFRWMQYNGYGRWRKLSEGGKSWYAVNANDLFEGRKGDCISYACALAYMAKVIGFKDVNVCSRGTRKDSFHTWTEINGLVYDSYFAKRRGMHKYYGVNYNKFDFKVVFRQKVPGKNSWLS